MTKMKATMAIENNHQHYQKSFGMSSLYMWLLFIVVSTSQADENQLQLELSFINGTWDTEIIQCNNQGDVMEIHGIFRDCKYGEKKELVKTQKDILVAFCQGRTNCNISKEEIDAALRKGCDGDMFIRVWVECVLGSNLPRMCSNETINAKPSQSLYGPEISTLQSGQMCRCVIESNVNTVKISVISLFIQGEVRLTIGTKNRSWWNENYTNVEWIPTDFEDEKMINITLSVLSKEPGIIERLFLLIEADTIQNMVCFNPEISSTTPVLPIVTTPEKTVSSTSIFSTPGDNSRVNTNEMLQDAEDLENYAVIIPIAVAVSLFVIIVVVVTVCVCKRKRKRTNDKHPEVSEMINTQYSDTSTFHSVPNGSMAKDAFLSTDNMSNGKKVNLQNSFDQRETEFQKTDNNSTGGLNELYGSTESGIAVSTEPDPEGHVQNNTIKTGKDLYDEALPVSHDPKVYKPSVFPGDLQHSSERPYYLYDDSHKKPTADQTGTYSGSSGDNTFHPEITDYAPSYHKTKGDDIKTLKPLAKQTPMNIANGSAQSLQAYSYADTRGRFVEGITPHIVGQGYDVEKPLPDDKYEQFQSPGGTNKVNMTGSKTNLGPYSYAACSVNPNPTGDLKPPEDASLAHYESMNAIYKPKESDNNESENAKNENPPAEYEGVAFPGKGQTPVIVNGVEMVENDVYSKE